MMTKEQREALAPGDRVAVVRQSRVGMTTVERLTKTQIVLSNGDRFYRATGHEVGSSTDVWSRTGSLSMHDDPRVVSMLAEMKFLHGIIRAESALAAFKKNPSDETMAVATEAMAALNAAWQKKSMED